MKSFGVEHPVCMLIAESTRKFMICFHVDSAMSVFDDLLFGDEHYIPFTDECQLVLFES
jgi:hypothetical protein